MLKNRLPKKVLEAKYRKKKKMINNLKKAQSEAAEIYDNEGLSPFTKARSINQLYRKAIKKSKPKMKQVFVSRRHLVAAPNKKSGRKFKMVDKRLKKDMRAQKRVEKQKKGIKSFRR
jgi:AdoMet-dependent rRNA methyltransferase SPB1